MAVPEFQTFMLPVLQHCADGQEHKTGETTDAVADKLGLSEADRQELLESGVQTRLKNRIAWSLIYLERARLLERVRRGCYRITDRGRTVLNENPERIDKSYLKRFPEFVEFATVRTTASGEEADSSEEDAGLTPEERLESAYRSLRKALAAELLEKVRQCSPQFFENLVVDLLVGMGYGGSRTDAGRAIGRTGDGGIDGIIKEDRLGLDVVLIQAKRWEAPVGAPVVRDFAGSLEGQRARKGVLITTSRFTSDAAEYVSRIEKKIVLIDGEQLAELMIDHGVGVMETARYALKKIDSDYFGEE